MTEEQMNKENLRKMADYVETIPQENFDMEYFRFEDDTSYKCDSIGCVIGHCTVLDDPKNIPLYPDGGIFFSEWSYKFTGISEEEWDWCFSEDWAHTDNTPTGAAKRIRFLLENGLPEDWEDQMNGFATISYLEEEK